MNKAFDGAYRKGKEAFKAGKSPADCPYHDTRAGKYGNIVTFSRAFMKEWHEGFLEAQREKENE
jgi:hypothetical protein